MDPSSHPAPPSAAQALFGPSGRWSLEPVAAWLLTRGRHITEPRAFLGALVEQLDAVDAHVDRVRISSSTLHPQLAALGISWSRGESVQLWSGEHGVQLSDAYRGSPMEHLQQQRRMLHQRIAEQPDGDEHPIWQDLRTAGMRDYLALPMELGFDDLWHGLTSRHAFVTQEVGDAVGTGLRITHKRRVIDFE
jgi:hypothetical protein